MRLILVRHGQTYQNVAKTIDTVHPGSVLTEEGWQQANDVVNDLVALAPQSIWASTLTRTQQTATPLATRLGMEINVRAGLREVEAGTLEGAHTQSGYDAYTAVTHSWIAGRLDQVMGDNPEVDGLRTLGRFDVVVREIEERAEECAVIFTHGTMMKTWAGARCAGVDRRHWGEPMKNTGIIVAEGDLDSGYQAVSWMGQHIAGRSEA
ncbi:histidine phosphatase family protein [Trueperella sp. LYQ141]|uniref:histidine phosphatase family protein n=1 Tax=Trueperella sp. LYQ141 TaxID=3391058 RepID=UPI0039832305